MPATSRSGEVGTPPLGERAQRLALEVEQDPARRATSQHLAEVVVAVDPLQGGPGGGRGRERRSRARPCS